MFPSISTSDFGLGDYNNYYYEGTLMYHYSWNNMIISYAHTCGAAVLDKPYLELFILKMEHVLRNIDFAKAIVHMQSVESLQSVNLFWEKREHGDFDTEEELKAEYLVKTEEWNFGYGKRSLKGYLDEPTNSAIYYLKNHPYPLRFSEKFTRLFFDRINLLTDDYENKGIPRQEFEKEPLLFTQELRMMISYLQFKKLITIEHDGEFELVKVINPDLLNMDFLYQ